MKKIDNYCILGKKKHMENIREFENVVDGYVVMYDDAADEYNILIFKDDFFCELNTHDFSDVVEFFNII